MPKESGPTSSLENCKRCLGKGEFTVVLGKPGQDVREMIYAEIDWEDPVGPFRCLACKGTGQRKTKPTQPNRKIRNTDYTGIEIT